MPFVPFLPRAGLYDPEYDEGLARIQEDVSYALQLGNEDLAAVFEEDPSLTDLLQSFLALAPPAWQPGHESKATQLIANLLQLLLRISEMEQANGLVAGNTSSLSSAMTRTALADLLTPGVLLQAAPLFHGLPECNAFLTSALRLQPDPASQLVRMARVAVRVLRTAAAATRLAVTAGSSGAGDSAGSASQNAGCQGAVLEQQLEQPLASLTRVLLGLCALLPAADPAALTGIAAEHELLELLAQLHDELCPRLAAKLSSQAGFQSLEPLRHTAALAQMACPRVAAILLVDGMLSRDDSPCVQGAGELEDGAKNNAKHTIHDAETRGAAVIEATLACVGSAPAAGPDAWPSMLQVLADRYGLPAALQRARADGVIALDDAQQDYLAAVVPGAWTAPAAVPPTGASGAVPAGVTGVDAGLVAAVKAMLDLVPDLGPGFAAAALQAAPGNSVEAALGAVFDGWTAPGLARDAGWDAYQAWKIPTDSTIAYDRAESVHTNGTARPRQARVAQLSNRGAGEPAKPGAATFHSGAAARYLDTRGGQLQTSIVSAALDAQWEEEEEEEEEEEVYDDEYDDEYDDSQGPAAAAGGEPDSESEATPMHRGRSDGAVASKNRGAPLHALELRTGQTQGFAPGQTKGLAPGQTRGHAPNQTKGHAPRNPGSVRPGAQDLMQAGNVGRGEIHGLGRGGNKAVADRARVASAQPQPVPSGEPAQQQQEPRSDPSRSRQPGRGRGGAPGPSRGSGPGPGREPSAPRPAGTGEPDRHAARRKEVHKAAVGNHNRKNQAAKKQSRGMV